MALKHWARWVAVFCPLTIGTVAVGEECPSAAARPEPISGERPRILDPYSVAQTVAHYYDAPLGLGFLEVRDPSNSHYYDWMFELALPLWREPRDGSTLGWLINGVIYANSNAHALTGAGMIETEYEHSSFIVWETRSDWFKLRLRDGIFAWTHRCHLKSQQLQLEFTPWESFFRQHGDWLHFRRPVPHILRSAPSADGERLTIIGLDHKLIMLGIEGDWMEVRVQQPDVTCRGGDDSDVQIVEDHGWIKWRDDQGPWVFVYTRGC